MEKQYDVVVIGGGPGGYTAAIQAAKRGLRTALVEEGEIGGTCLNRGCVPAKAMLHAAELLRQAKEGGQFGLHAEGARLDYAEMLSYRDDVVASLREGVAAQLRSAGVVCINGRGRLLPGRRVRMTGADGEAELVGENIILAAGSCPKLPPIPGIALDGVLTSDGIFALDRPPESLIIIGGGAIGVEFAEAFCAMGARVALIEAQPKLLPGMDREISQTLRMLLKRRSVELHLGASIREIRREEGSLACAFTENGQEVFTWAEFILCAVGRAANTRELFAPGAQPELSASGQIVVDESFRTSLDRVYAIGDLIPGPQLAHAASAQGRTVAQIIAGETPSADLALIPACVYAEPEIAQVGLTEQRAKELGVRVRIVKAPVAANPRAQISHSDRGFVKLVADADTDALLGAQLMCERATDIIGELALAISNHLTIPNLLRPVRPHPTFEEIISNVAE